MSGKIRDRFPRDVDIRDIDPKNTELLTKFVNPAGKIKNRTQNRLKDSVHTRAEKAIKRARQMQLLPSNSMIKPSDKISLSSLLNDVQDMCKKVIDPNNGRVYKYSEMRRRGRQLASEQGDNPRMTKIPVDVLEQLK